MKRHLCFVISTLNKLAILCIYTCDPNVAQFHSGRIVLCRYDWFRNLNSGKLLLLIPVSRGRATLFLARFVCFMKNAFFDLENVKQLFECFCEVAAPIREKPAWILQKYPNSFSDEEILKSVPKFAYPCEFENLLVQHFSFVLTSIDSKWTFGFCRHDPKTETALVVLSALPWHETFYKLLNHIASLTSSASGEDPWKFLEIIYTCGVPIPGNSISIPLPNSTANFICQSPKQFQLPSIPENRNLTEYYSAVDSHNMMMIFASMLYERRIIFISKRLSRLSACVQACNALIYPMIWQHIYIPVLPLSLIDYLLAPMPFLIGVPTLTLQFVEMFQRNLDEFLHRLIIMDMNKVPKSDLGEVVILDADNNTIESPFQDLESLPQDVVRRLNRSETNMRFHQPRSAPSSPTIDRRSIGFTSPPKSPNDISVAINCRKDLRLRNNNFTDTSRKQYSPLSPSSPEESDSPLERINIDLMHELQDVIFPNIPVVDKTIFCLCHPKFQQNNLIDAIKVFLQNGYPLSFIFSTIHNRIKYHINKFNNLNKNKDDSGGRFFTIPYVNTISERFIPVVNMLNCKLAFTIPNTLRSFIRRGKDDLEHVQSQNVVYRISCDDCDASYVGQTKRQLKTRLHEHVSDINISSKSPSGVFAGFTSSDSSDVPDLIRLDSINSNDDFDPLLSKSSEFSSTKQMSQSLYLPEMGEGLSNPLYPYFQQPSHKTDKPKTSDNVGDTDLLQAYGIDFNKFSLSNSDNSFTINTAACNQSDNSINDTMDTFSLTLDAPTIKSQNNWTKFE
ncbi:DEN1B protein, partial [Acromyrmex insinuator]